MLGLRLRDVSMLIAQTDSCDARLLCGVRSSQPRYTVKTSRYASADLVSSHLHKTLAVFLDVEPNFDGLTLARLNKINNAAQDWSASLF